MSRKQTGLVGIGHDDDEITNECYLSAVFGDGTIVSCSGFYVRDCGTYWRISKTPGRDRYVKVRNGITLADFLSVLRFVEYK